MRIESPVGCPTSAGDPAEEKTVREGSAGLFTNILDCVRALLSGSLSEDAAARCEEPAATGKSTIRSRTVAPGDDSSLPVISETEAIRPRDVHAEDSSSRKDRTEGSEACAVPVSMIPAVALFPLAVPKAVPNGQPIAGTSDPAAGLTGARVHEAVPAAVSRIPVGLPQQAEIPRVAINQQGGVPLGDGVPPQSNVEVSEQSTAPAEGTSDSGFDPRSHGQAHEVSNPQVSTQGARPAELSIAVQATAPPLVIDANVFQPEGSVRSAVNTPAPSSFSAHSTPGIPFDRGTEPKASSHVASATPWMPQRSGNVEGANMSQPGVRAAKGEATSESTPASDGSRAYTRATRTAYGTVPAVQTNVDESFAGPHFVAQKLPEMVLSATSGQSTGRLEAGNRTELRSDPTSPRADAQLPWQAESVARPAGASKTSTAVDAATLAVEPEKALAGRGRLRAVVESGAREDSVVSSPSGMVRDAKALPQATAGVRDVKAPAFVFEVAERISAVVAGNRGEVTVQLKPDQFGRMNIVAESGAGGILARITTESASLKQYLESNLPVLQQALQEQGLKVERIDVMFQEGLLQQQSADQWQHNFGHAPRGHDSDRNARFAAPAPTQPAEPANEITLDAIILGALHPHSTFHTVA